MNTFVAITLACLVAVANASVYGHGAVVSGPSGVVTDHGAIGPVHHGVLGLGLGHAAVVAPVAHVGVVAHGLGLGHAIAHHSIDGVVAHGHHGVVVEGPHTVPAVVSGPSGKIVADGLYGVPHHGHHW